MLVWHVARKYDKAVEVGQKGTHLLFREAQSSRHAGPAKDNFKKGPKKELECLHHHHTTH